MTTRLPNGEDSLPASQTPQPIGPPTTGVAFQELQARRVQDILLVSTLYESFILAEDGRLNDLIVSEYVDLNLRHTPGLTRVRSGDKALEVVALEPRHNLIITTLGVGDAAGLAERVRAARLDVPVVVLAFDNQALSEFTSRYQLAPSRSIERAFLWQGDARILPAIVKQVEDRWNADFDCNEAGTQCILVVEDSVRYYSSFLPLIYTEVFAHSHRLVADGINLPHKVLRMRARPKILLATTWEEAVERIDRYGENLLGLVSDFEFPRGGERRPEAGLELVRHLRLRWPDVPALLQSSRPENRTAAYGADADFLVKGSPTLLSDLGRFMSENFGFGDFVFRDGSGREVARARDLRSLEGALRTASPESIAYHAASNHFSVWLKARTEFDLARKLRPRRVEDYPSVEALRADLVDTISTYRRNRHRGIVADFDPSTYDDRGSLSRIGGGSLGGKARGLAFVRRMLDLYWKGDETPDLEVGVPAAVVLGTDVFDAFLADNGLLDFALTCEDDELLYRRFLEARFPAGPREDLRAYLELVDHPIAVRSSSLLEDSQRQPFTGVYETYMLANNEPDPAVRLARLVDAVQRVYASTFSSHAKGYLKATPYRLEEEKMAVLVQRIVGTRRGDVYYPNFAGVARSHNFYPTGPQRPEDGVVAVGIGLGRTVVDGGACVRFSPAWPRHADPAPSIDALIDTSQRSFFAIPCGGTDGGGDVELGLERAEADGTLGLLASTYSPANDALYDGTSRDGIRVVTFAPVLKMGLFPLAHVTRRLMEIGESCMGSAVEIEFAVNLPPPGAGGSPEFGFLQMRPLVLTQELETLNLEVGDPAELLCESDQVLGSGRVDDIYDIVVVPPVDFERGRSRLAAEEIARLNARLLDEGRPYALIGPGRWGSTDRWLGIPVSWDEIAGVRVIVEVGFEDMVVTPSQGTHFFQNLASFRVGYFTVPGAHASPSSVASVDWDWLAAQPALVEGEMARLIRLEAPLEVRMNGVQKRGVILKPEEG